MTPPLIFELTTPEGRGVFAELDGDGVVTFVIWAGEGSSIRGTEMNRMVRHFGEKVRGIRGVWRANSRGEPSTNIDKVNELTAKGMALSEAIRQAWTVTRAAKLGYRRVRLLGTPEGEAGAYRKIDVLIEQ